MMASIEVRVARAVRSFWKVRGLQQQKQKSSRVRDQGGRSAVTGGAQMDGFVDLVAEILVENGVPKRAIFRDEGIAIPGFFRPTKDWDLLVVHENQLVASIEFKSQVGPSFGNNYNNRTEEALGNATDLWTAYREGAFRLSPRPWLGFLMLLEECPRSTMPVGVREPHFPVFSEFRGASYAGRYEQLCRKLVRERLYDSTCLILSDRKSGAKGGYREPSPELSTSAFVTSLIGKTIAHFKTGPTC